MGVTTTLYAVPDDQVAALGNGALDFNASKRCQIDKAGPALWFFAGLASWDALISEAALELVPGTEFRGLPAAELGNVARQLSTDVIAKSLSDAPADIFARHAIYPFTANDHPAQVADYLISHASCAQEFLRGARDAGLGVIMVTT